LTFELLSSLWLHEPDDETIARAHRELGLPMESVETLAQAYTDVFLLNVPPYGTAYTDEYGELNGERAQAVAQLFDVHGYAPPELSEVAAPDHVGLCLKFLAYLEERELEIRELEIEWIPICCLAVEREPTAPDFYRALATQTRQAIFAQSTIINPQSPISNLQFSNPLLNEELRLKDILRFFLTPARCGLFLSRSRLGQMAKQLGMRLPFGSRWEVAEALFIAAGEGGQIQRLLMLIETETQDWLTMYKQWREHYPTGRPLVMPWVEAGQTALQMLGGLKELAEHNQFEMEV
jgi:TorA maturation chaperone TorD